MSLDRKHLAPVLALVATLAACGGSGPTQPPEVVAPTASASPGGGSGPTQPPEVVEPTASASPGGMAPSPAASTAPPPPASDAPATPDASYEPDQVGRVYVSIDGVEVGWVAIAGCFHNPDGSLFGSLTIAASDEHGIVAVVVPDPIPGQIAGTVNGHDFAITEGGYANSLDGDIGTFGGVDGVSGSKITGRFNCP